MTTTAGPLSAQAGQRRYLFGVWLDALRLNETVRRCVDAASRDELLEIGVVNAAKLVRMRKDPALRDAVRGCDLIVADGQSVVWASRLLRRPLPERVAGIDLFTTLLAEAERDRLSVYLLGAKPEVLADTRAEIARRFPDLHIAGSQHGYYSEAEAPEVADRIAASGAHLLFLGMTSPKKEVFVARYGRRTGARVVHGVGGSFDVLAGVVKRAPMAWQRAGMEWLYRALQEPRRLGPRYLATNFAFLGMVAWELVRPGRPDAGGRDADTPIGKTR